MIKEGTKLRCIKEEENITKGKIYKVEFLSDETFKYAIREDDNRINQYSEEGIKIFFEVVNFEEGDIVKVTEKNFKCEDWEHYKIGEIFKINSIRKGIKTGKSIILKEGTNYGLFENQIELVEQQEDNLKELNADDKSNLKLTFKELINRELKENEEWYSNNYIVELWVNGRFSIKRKDGGQAIAFWNDQEIFKYKKIVKPVSFQDAFKEYINGKAIQPECNREVIFKLNGGIDTESIIFASKAEVESKWLILD